MFNSTVCTYNVLAGKQSVIAITIVEQFNLKRQSNISIYWLVSRVMPVVIGKYTGYLLICPLAPAVSTGH